MDSAMSCSERGPGFDSPPQPFSIILLGANSHPKMENQSDGCDENACNPYANKNAQRPKEILMKGTS